jgi:hypothetical protein
MRHTAGAGQHFYGSQHGGISSIGCQSEVEIVVGGLVRNYFLD